MSVVFGNRLVLATWVALTLLAGCMPSLESTEPPVRTYWLDPADIAEPAAVRLDIEVVPGLNTDHIGILEADQRLNYYAGAFWADSLRPLLDSVLHRSLGEASPDAPHLTVTIERFFALESSDERPEVELRARIEGVGPGSSGSGTCRFATVEQARSARLQDIVAAHQLLVEQLAGEINRIAGSNAPC